MQDLNKKEGITIFFTTHYIEEAEKVAAEVAVIDRGKIVAQGTPADLKQKTNAGTLEDAFLNLTGRKIREEEAGAIDHLRMRRRVFHR
jgi:ABC-2 type transport system ATP-binding protein